MEWIIFPNYLKLNLKSFVNQHSLPCKTKANNQHVFFLFGTDFLYHFSLNFPGLGRKGGQILPVVLTIVVLTKLCALRPSIIWLYIRS